MKKNALILLLLILFSCKRYLPDKTNYFFQNNSNEAVYIAVSYDFPDTTLININSVIPPIGDKNPNFFPVSKKNKAGLRNRFKSIGIHQIFVFNKDTLEIKGWEYVKTNNKILKRIQFDEDFVKNKNWTIIYP